MNLDRAVVDYTEDTAGLWQNPDVVSAVSGPAVGAAYFCSSLHRTGTSDCLQALHNLPENKTLYHFDIRS